MKSKWIILIQNLNEENNAYAGCRNERLGRDEKRKGKSGDAVRRKEH